MSSELTDAEIDVPTRDHRLDVRPAELETREENGKVLFFDRPCDGRILVADEDHVLEGAEME